MAFTGVALLEYKWNEAPGAMHVFNVRLADGLAERLLLNAYPVHMAKEHTREQGDQAGPVGHCETYAQHGQERTTVSRMAHIAVRANLHHLLISRHRYIAGKVAPQYPDGVPAQGYTEEDQDHPGTKECCSLPGDGCCRKQPAEQEIQCDAAPL